MSLKIVVVDDEAPICEWLAYCIKKLPGEHQTFTADNGSTALDLILREHPDLVFTDIQMPGIDGLELMRQVKEMLPFTIFIILSNYAEFTYARRALAMGAKDYLLKSELRSADIAKIVADVSAKNELSLSRNKDDVYASGCIDLRNFYSTQEEPDFAQRFWLKQGMSENKPYLLLCYPAGKTPDDWRNMAQLAATLGQEFGNRTYTAVASETGFDFMIIQSGSPLRPMAQKAAEAVVYRGNTGISDIFSRLSDFPAALKQAACAQASLFFSLTGKAVFYQELTGQEPLDREALSERMTHILLLISQRKYVQAEEESETWFSEISRPAPADVTWAVDSCRRMVMSVEERYYRLRSLPAPAIQVRNSLSECTVHCSELLSVLQQVHTGQCSAPVREALDYIHEHYSEQISMAEVARRVFWSAEYFSRQFKEETGENFNTYLTLYRLDRAQDLLNQTDLRISEIAEKVGYTTPGYFSRIYKRYKGITPEQERESK